MTTTTTTPPNHSKRFGRTLAVAALSGALLTTGISAPASAVTSGEGTASVATKERPSKPAPPKHDHHKPAPPKHDHHPGKHRHGPYKDVPAKHPYAKSIQWAKDYKVLSGYRDGTFRPNQAVSRGDTANALYRMAGSPRYYAPKRSPFRDVKTSHPQYKQIAWAESKGLLQDHRGWFNPDRGLTHGETASALYKFSGSPKYNPPRRSAFKDVDRRDRNYKEIHWMKDAGLVKGDRFFPKKSTTRGETADYLYKLGKNWR